MTAVIIFCYITHQSEWSRRQTVPEERTTPAEPSSAKGQSCPLAGPRKAPSPPLEGGCSGSGTVSLACAETWTTLGTDIDKGTGGDSSSRSSGMISSSSSSSSSTHSTGSSIHRHDKSCSSTEQMTSHAGKRSHRTQIKQKVRYLCSLMKAQRC